MPNEYTSTKTERAIYQDLSPTDIAAIEDGMSRLGIQKPQIPAMFNKWIFYVRYQEPGAKSRIVISRETWDIGPSLVGEGVEGVINSLKHYYSQQ